jgi:acetyl-CoA C-acetyltransferase
MMSQPQAYIVEAVRTATGRRNGTLARMHSADLAGATMRGLLDRTRIDPNCIEDVIWGLLDPVGPQAHDMARVAWLSAGLPEHVPGVTVDRQCGSAQQAIHFAAQAVMSGTQDVVVAGGSQSMSMIPMNSSLVAGQPLGFENQYVRCEGWSARYGDQEVNQFRGAELMAKKWSINREATERYALESHRRALAAIAAGHFKREILPLGPFDTDETPRVTSLEKMAALAPIRSDGVITAATASQIADGAAALLVVSERALKDHGLTPRARIHHLSVLADDPVMMLSAPIPATRRALERAGMTIRDIDVYEVNEAFAPVPIAWLRELDGDPARLNANGGAIALGHPLGATGARLMTTLLHELERSGGRYGLQTMCEAGGQANVTIIERLS